MAIYNNLPGTKAVIRTTGSVTVNLSDLASPNSTFETVNSATITKLYWYGDWTIKRGANTLLVVGGGDNWQLQDGGLTLTEDNTASIVIQAGATAGVILIEVKKQSNRSAGGV